MSTFRSAVWRPALFLSLVVLTAPFSAAAAGTVNIYSYREPKLIEPLLKGFTEQTGITTNVVFATTGLVERLESEGRNSPADVLLANEFGWLIKAKQAGISTAVDDPAIPTATGLA
jgi:iron(III) transport system substrate-binding protein